MPNRDSTYGVRIEVQRKRLFEALGIIEVSRHALASKLTPLNEDSVIDALKAAYRIVSGVAEALENPLSDLGAPYSAAQDE